MRNGHGSEAVIEERNRNYLQNCHEIDISIDDATAYGNDKSI